MTKEEALKVLDNVVSQVSMSRENHNRCVEALQVLQKCITEKKK